MMKRLRALSAILISMVCSGQILGGIIETNLSGYFDKGDKAELYITGLGNSGFNFRLSTGNITPGEGCANGPTDCLSLWGWATRTATGEFLYANENGQCLFYLKNEADVVVLHGLRGTCGSDAQNRAALTAIEGTYTPRR